MIYRYNYVRGLAAAAVTASATLMAVPASAQQAEPCIGGSWELTGGLAHIGLQIRYGVEVALAEINAAGGVLGQELQLRVYDDAGEPPRAVDNVLRIGEQDNCVAVIGGARTPNAIAVRESLDELGMPWIGVISAGVRVLDHETGENRWMFRVGLNDGWVAPFLMQNAVDLAGDGGVGFLYEATAWGQGAVATVNAAAEEMGVDLVGEETFNIGDTDMSAQLLRLRDAGAEALVYYGVDGETDAILRSMERIDYRPTLVAALGIGALLSETAGPLADGVRVIGSASFWGDLDEQAQGVLDAIVERYSEVSGPKDLLLHSGTASAYDVTHIIARAIEIAGEFDREKVREALYEVSYDGLIKNYDPAFQPGVHDALSTDDYNMFVFYDGMVVPVEQSPFASE